MLKFRSSVLQKDSTPFLEHYQIQMKWKVLLIAGAACVAAGSSIQGEASEALSNINGSPVIITAAKPASPMQIRRRCRRTSPHGRCIKQKAGQKRIINKKGSTVGPVKDGGMKKAGEFNGDLRTLPKSPQKPQATAPVRESGDKPRVAPTPAKTPHR